MLAGIADTTVLQEKAGGERECEFQPGPIFSGIVLGDEISRATPKSHSALLEKMQERVVTVSGMMHPLPEPSLVFAIQNPIAMEGTHPLSEA